MLLSMQDNLQTTMLKIIQSNIQKHMKVNSIFNTKDSLQTTTLKNMVLDMKEYSQLIMQKIILVLM